MATKPSPQLFAIPGGGLGTQKDSPSPTQLKATKTQLFLLRVVGADLNLLARPECTHEIPKFLIAGWTLILGGLLAGISASFALFRIFNGWAVLPFGALFGFFTFTVDRAIVVSMRKTRNGSLRTLCLAIPRILLAGMIALTVAKPLEIKLFESEINYQLSLDATRARAAHVKEVDEGHPEIAQLEQERDHLQNEIDTALKNRDQALKESVEEAEGKAGNGKGEGPLYNVKEAFAETRVAELETIRKRDGERIQQIEQKLADLRSNRDTEVSDVQDAQRRAHGLLASLRALEEIGHDPEYGRALLVAMTFVTALFLLIDIAPVLVKLLSPFSVYDALLESREKATMVHTESLTESLTNRLNDETSHRARLDQQVLDFEQDLFRRALGKLRGTPEADANESEIGASLLDRAKERLKTFSIW
jgi:hypothetical protein